MIKPSGGDENEWLSSSAGRGERGFVTRRGLLSSAVAALFAGGFTSLYLAGTARADAAVTELGVTGDAITTDNGQITGLTAAVSGHVSYDGLDAPAETVEVELFAAPSGGSTGVDRNRIAQSSMTVALESNLGTHAGHRDFNFVDVDVLAADDLSESDFAAPVDGTTTDTDVAFRIALSVSDLDGTVLVSTDATSTATISVTNEASSGNAGGSGNTNAEGTNQSP